jgi:hypothetical protein
MRRLLSAVGRFDPIDGFVGAVVCCENLFEDAQDTTLRVRDSIALMLKPARANGRRLLSGREGDPSPRTLDATISSGPGRLGREGLRRKAPPAGSRSSRGEMETVGDSDEDVVPDDSPARKDLGDLALRLGSQGADPPLRCAAPLQDPVDGAMSRSARAVRTSAG